MKAIDIHGWMSKRELGWLSKHARNCDLIIEIGTWFGRSAFAMAENVRGKVICIDHFLPDSMRGFSQRKFYRHIKYIPRSVRRKNPNWLYDKCLENLDEFLKNGKIEIIRGSSEVVINDLGYLKGRVDMVFIDGDHSYEAVKRDIENYKPLLHGGGLLCGHDYARQVKVAINEILPKAKVARGTGIWAYRC